mmetsp:Transcript_41162/g.92783  ORF Transcript_41162/g.92783 Transcript_41162/m.92783 type:complete len:245 (+) Transcript_41162:1204-1938(+)
MAAAATPPSSVAVAATAEVAALVLGPSRQSAWALGQALVAALLWLAGACRQSAGPPHPVGPSRRVALLKLQPAPRPLPRHPPRQPPPLLPQAAPSAAAGPAPRGRRRGGGSRCPVPQSLPSPVGRLRVEAPPVPPLSPREGRRPSSQDILAGEGMYLVCNPGHHHHGIRCSRGASRRPLPPRAASAWVRLRAAASADHPVTWPRPRSGLLPRTVQLEPALVPQLATGHRPPHRRAAPHPGRRPR